MEVAAILLAVCNSSKRSCHFDSSGMKRGCRRSAPVKTCQPCPEPCGNSELADERTSLRVVSTSPF
eukprot:7383970-Prymnesium_polylepis.1